MADHPLYAAVYDRMMAGSEARGLSDRRRTLLAGARGRVLEIGAGTGLNLTHYPPDTVSSVVVLEPDAAMRRRLLERIGSGTPPVAYEVHEAGIDDAIFPDGSFDTVVATLVLCTVPDQQRAVGAIRRWLAPDGRLLFLEHVRATGLTGRLQRAARPLWQHLAAGCQLDRDTLGMLRQAGLAVTDCERFAMPASSILMSSCVQGVARPRPVVMEGPGPDRY
jgi:SAM-dependent methyltransferase